MIIDMWNNHKFREVKSFDSFFYPNDTIYRGNLYNKNRQIIGDYATRDSLEIERRFKHLNYR